MIEARHGSHTRLTVQYPVRVARAGDIQRYRPVLARGWK
jgi:hypothetical protein